MITMLTHTIISAGLARTYNPAVSLAAYAVALGLSEIFEAPLVLLRQVVVALTHSIQDYKEIRRVSVITMAVLMICVTLISYVPYLSYIVFQKILGVSSELFLDSLIAFRVLMLLPIVSGFRCLYQGLLLLERRTGAILRAMLYRAATMGLIVFAFTRFGWVKGALVGAIALIAGVFIEGAAAYCYGHAAVPKTLGSQSPKVWRFYIPLLYSALLASAGKPFINSGLARLPDSAQVLAAYSVAASLAWIIISPTLNLHQVVMVFCTSSEEEAQASKFTLLYALASSLTLLFFVVTPAGVFVLGRLMGVPQTMQQAILTTMGWMVPLPLVLSWQEHKTGLLLSSQASGLVGLSKVLNLTITVLAVLLLSHRLYGPVVAPLAQLAGGIAGGAVLQLANKTGAVQRLPE